MVLIYMSSSKVRMYYEESSVYICNKICLQRQEMMCRSPKYSENYTEEEGVLAKVDEAFCMSATC
jgi:hypothetical protein